MSKYSDTHHVGYFCGEEYLYRGDTRIVKVSDIDQQQARIAELEAENAAMREALDKVWAATQDNALPQAVKFDVEQALRELGYGEETK